VARERARTSGDHLMGSMPRHSNTTMGTSVPESSLQMTRSTYPAVSFLELESWRRAGFLGGTHRRLLLDKAMSNCLRGRSGRVMTEPRGTAHSLSERVAEGTHALYGRVTPFISRMTLMYVSVFPPLERAQHIHRSSSGAQRST
jgi:hypothetical protein